MKKGDFNQNNFNFDGGPVIELNPEWKNADIISQISRRVIPAIDHEFTTRIKRYSWMMDSSFGSDKDIFWRRVDELYSGYTPKSGYLTGVDYFVPGFKQLLDVFVFPDLARRTEPEFLTKFLVKVYHSNVRSGPNRYCPGPKRNELQRRAYLNALGIRYSELFLGHPLHWNSAQRYIQLSKK